MVKTKLYRTVYGLGIVLIVAMIAVLGAEAAHAQEIPNGDGDLLWERPLNGRTVNDAKFHPTNGNIIAAVNHEIWEIDPKDGHTIRIFEGGYPADVSDAVKTINITSDGQKVITGGAMGKKGILIWDYNSGLVIKIITLNKIFDVYENIGIYPDNNRIVFNTYQNNYGSQSNIMHINVYDIQKDSIIKRVNIADTYCARFRMSDNGRFIAYGFAKGSPSEFNYTMELWDVETLTKIKDFGEAKVGDFLNIQISHDNRYIGYLGNPRMYLIDNTNNTLKIIEEAKSFTFSNGAKTILLQKDTSLTKPTVDDLVTFLYSLETFDSLYQYRDNPLFNYRYSQNNNLLAGKWNLKYYSNRWDSIISVNIIEIKKGIMQIIYLDNSINLKLENIESIDELLVIDTLGKKLFSMKEMTPFNDELTIPLALPSGNYLIKITSRGIDFNSKFTVVR